MLNVDFNGRLGADAELRTSKNGNKYVSMRVATDDFNGVERTTTWVNVTWLGERAIKTQEHMKKGSLVSIRGILRASLYTTKAGEQAISLDVLADRIDFVSIGNSSTTVQSDATVEVAQKQEETPTPTQAKTPMSNVEVNSDDDLPF